MLQVSDPVPLETLTMRGCAERRSAGKNALVTATTPNTLVSYVRRNTSTSVSVICVPVSSEMPALLTRTSSSETVQPPPLSSQRR